MDERDLSEMTVDTFANTWLRHSLQNLPAIGRTAAVTELAGALAGVPAVIVGAGPSLAKNVRDLAGVGDKGVILACSRACLTLQAAGIVPDFVVVLDPQDLSHHFDGYRWDQRTILVLGVSSHPAMFALPPRKLVYSANADMDAWAFAPYPGEGVRVQSGGSVACTAFSLARMWACEPIVLVGMDLAFSATETHVGTPRAPDGSFSEQLVMDTPPEQKPVRTVPGYDGVDVETGDNLAMFRNWFAAAAQVAQSEGCQVVNATEGGARIEWTQQCALAHVLPVLKSQGWFRGVIDRATKITGTREALMRSHVAALVALTGDVEKKAAHCANLAIHRKADELPEAEQELHAAVGPLEMWAALALRGQRKEIIRMVAEAKTVDDRISAALANYVMLGNTARMVRPILEEVSRAA